MSVEKRGTVLLSGLRSKSDLVVRSVARANAAKVFMDDVNKRTGLLSRRNGGGKSDYDSHDVCQYLELEGFTNGVILCVAWEKNILGHVHHVLHDQDTAQPL